MRWKLLSQATKQTTKTLNKILLTISVVAGFAIASLALAPSTYADEIPASPTPTDQQVTPATPPTDTPTPTTSAEPAPTTEAVVPAVENAVPADVSAPTNTPTVAEQPINPETATTTTAPTNTTTTTPPDPFIVRAGVTHRFLADCTGQPVDANNTCTVSATPLQTAITFAIDGETVNIEAGTYDMGATIITIDKSLTIQGPNALISPNGVSRVAEAIIKADNSIGTFNIHSASVTVVFEGLDFQTDGAEMRSDYPGATITLRKNIFTGSRADGMFFQDPNLTVDDNLFTGYHTTASETIQMGAAVTRIGTISITNNTWTDITGNGALNSSGQTGTVSGNTFDGVEYYGILVASDANVSADLTISNNTFNNITNPTVGPTGNELTWGAGVRFWQANSATVASITGNSFSNSYLGVSVRATNSDITGADIHVNNNSFTGNLQAILNAGTGTLDATNNWWGSTANPSATLNGDVTFAPWCAQAACTSLMSDGEPVILTAIGGVATTSSDGPMTLTGSTSSVTIPEGTTITGSGGSGTWDGTLNSPTVVPNSSVSIPNSGESSAVLATVIEFGSGTFNLSFDKAVRILIPNQGGKYVGFTQNGGTFTPIELTCTGDSQAQADAQLFPPGTGECKITIGPDMVVWTTHFTKFATFLYTSVGAPPPPSGGSGGGGSSPPPSSPGGSSPSPGDSGGSTSPSNPSAGTTQPNTTTTSSPARFAYGNSGGTTNSQADNEVLAATIGPETAVAPGPSQTTAAPTLAADTTSQTHRNLWWLLILLLIIPITYYAYQRFKNINKNK